MKQLVLAVVTLATVAALVLAYALDQTLVQAVKDLLASGAGLDINSPVWSVVLALFAGVWVWMIATALRVNPARCASNSECARH